MVLRASRGLGPCRPGWRSAPWLVALACLLPLACGQDQPSDPIARTPSDDLPEISAELFALAAQVQGTGVELRWRWSDKSSYPVAQIERRVGDAGTRSVIAGPFRSPTSGCLDPDVGNGVTYAYRVRACNEQGEDRALSPWVVVTIDAAPMLTVNGGEAVAGASPVRADLLATDAEAMRIAWGADPTEAAWQPLVRSFEIEPPASGTYTVSCQVRYPDDTLSDVLVQTFVLDLTEPLASFLLEVIPTDRMVRVDASGSVDEDGICPPSELAFRWSWGDEKETDRGSQPGATHTYTEPGVRTIRLTVTDWAGHAVQVEQEADLSNRAPAMPGLLTPENAAAEVSRLPRFLWTGSPDAEGDAVTYTLYLGTAEPLSVAAEGLTTTSWDLETPLAAETTYSWRVTAIDVWDGASASVAASFRTAANSAPAIPDDPYPANWQERVSTWPLLTWSPCVDPEGGDVRYDLYFGTALPLEPLAQNLASPSHQPDPLASRATYLWKVVARDADGTESSSRTWRFQTGAEPSVPLATFNSGAFVMGSAAAAGDAGNAPHEVELSRAYWLGTHEVTNAQYAEMLMRAQARRLVEYADGRVRANGQVLIDLTLPDCRLERQGQGYVVACGYEQHPVVGVTWCGAAAFCDWMNDTEGLPPSYSATDEGSGAWALAAGTPGATPGYRLPTEAEWEHASQRAGSRAYPWGDEAPSCALANLAGCAGGTVAVGSFPPAPDGVGLYDLAGNVSEWCQDWWQADLSGASQLDPAGPGAGSLKVVRGGDWDDAPDAARCAWRTSSTPGGCSGVTGFRVARSAGF